MMALKKSTDLRTLAHLLSGLTEIDPADDRSLCGVKSDSREISNDDLFLACRGFRRNGAEFIDDAIAAGACAVVVDAELTCKKEDNSVPVISVANLNAKVGVIAHRFYQYPSDGLNVIGITGTNGKTSIAHIIAQVLSTVSGVDAGIIGTLGIGSPGKMQAGLNTTPDALTVHHALAVMRDRGAENVVMEVSSHALTQARVAEVKFDIGIFTNLSREHLDYHGDMDTYAEAKRQLFLTESLATAIINTDDEYGQKLQNDLRGKLRVISYSIGKHAEHDRAEEHVSAIVTDSRLGALSLDVSSPWGKGRLTSKLTGEFNASNLLACLSALCLSGIAFTEALEHLSGIEPIPGRMECFAKEGFARVIVDYAHTPDALEKALKSLREINNGNLICVIGCGGNRDQSKRSRMGRIAEMYSTGVILTNDNPRNEDPDAIIEQMLAGMERRDSVSVIPDRSAAISQAISSATMDDIVLIAGKGHETWQDIAGVRTPFSDRQLVRNILEQAQ